MPKVCICFYGLVQRSLKYTLGSIETNIFNVLKDNNIDYDTYIHTYDSSFSHSPRGKEINVPVNVDDYKLLNPNDYIIESYNKADNIINYKQYPDRTYNDNYTSILNWIRELYSIKQVTNLWHAKKDEYDFYLYIRPDLMYVTPLPITYLQYHLNKNVGKNILFTVPWSRSSGLYDFAEIGNYDSIIKWANRIDTFNEYMEKINNNAERHVLFLCQKYNITYIDLLMLFYRKRANGISMLSSSWYNNSSYIKPVESIGCKINTKFL